MKRRNFLKSLLAGAVASALPGCRLPTGPNEGTPSFEPVSKYVDVDIVELKSGELGRVDGFQHFESVRFIESTPEDRAGNWDTPNWDAYSWHEKPPFERDSVEFNGHILTRKQYDNLGKAMAEHNGELDRAMIEGMRDAARQLDISAWRGFTAS